MHLPRTFALSYALPCKAVWLEINVPPAGLTGNQPQLSGLPKLQGE
jgi:hypothetical protein